MKYIRLNVTVPSEDHMAMKIKAAKKNQTIIEAVREAIKNWNRGKT